ncbi:MAG: UDP-N-acetylglucosamine--N-acetylmuramyl-(pentapeptide) pyrophosphoryl-undecaprenol N-acetylglucosamine transferase [Patescibacteria group bacterium]
MGVQPVKIVLTGGGSGGHITPLLPLARALRVKNPQCTIIYIGLRGDKIDALQTRYGAFDEVHFITSGKFRRYHGESLLAHLVDVKTLMLNFRDAFRVLFGTLMALRLLRKYRPDVVFSKGGYVVVPVGLAAHLHGVPIITHDSDAAAGLANKIIGRWAKIHTTAMAPKYYPYPSDSIRQVGIPVDGRLKPVDAEEQKSLKRQIGLAPDNLMLLVAGGGLGSQTINELMAKISPELLKNNPRLEIVHFSGSGHQDSLTEHYQRELGEEMPQRVKVLGFSSDFYAYSGAADVVLARAGATTLAELAIQRKAAVIIPSPFLTSGHQLKNAEELTLHSAAVVLPNNIEPQKLLSTLNDLLQNTSSREQLARSMGSLARPNAAAELADILLEAAKV